jgi:membrane protease YdiL (CAAX protease family)
MSLLYLKYTCTLSVASLGLKRFYQLSLQSAGGSLFAGLGIIFILGTSLIITDVYGLHSSREFTLTRIIILLIGAMLTGMAVAIFEEIVFRGALLQGLLKKTNATVAIVATSIIYAGVHFIGFSSPEQGETVNFFSTITQIIPAYSGLISTNNYDAFLALVLLGALLGMIRVKTDSIIQCIYFHAGLVAGIKIFRYCLQYNPDGQYAFLVSSHDYRLGFMAMFIIALALLLYYLVIFRRPAS